MLISTRLNTLLPSSKVEVGKEDGGNPVSGEISLLCVHRCNLAQTEDVSSSGLWYCFQKLIGDSYMSFRNATAFRRHPNDLCTEVCADMSFIWLAGLPEEDAGKRQSGVMHRKSFVCASDCITVYANLRSQCKSMPLEPPSAAESDAKTGERGVKPTRAAEFVPIMCKKLCQIVAL